MARKVFAAIGTRKGAFIMEAEQDRQRWIVRGPYLEGKSIMHMAFDQRTGNLLAAALDFWFGARVYQSANFGRTWDEPVTGPKFAESSGQKLEKVWEVVPGRPEEPGVIYAGCEPASLFKSSDGGVTWQHIESLNEHPTAKTWMPSAGGLCLHSVTLDPIDLNRMYVAISAGGLYATTDGGQTWEPRNKGVRADFFGEEPPYYPETGQCVHRAGLHPAIPNRLYQQNHCGVYRSDDAGLNWTEVTEGLPAEWGLAMAIHAHDPECFYVAPATSQMLHYPEGGRFAVYRTRDAGGIWERLDKGLPESGAFVNVLREGLAVDGEDPCGVYVGTNTGQLWTSANEGDTWQAAQALFPPISSVTAFSA